MESSYSPERDDNEAPIDPGADLALLGRARSSVEIDQALDLGPWWLTPLAAAAIAAGSLAAHQGSRPALIVVTVVCLLLALYDRQRRPVRPRPTVLRAPFVVPFALGAFALLLAWEAAISRIGYDDFVPVWALVGWGLTTGLMLGVRSLLHSIRKRRQPIG